MTRNITWTVERYDRGVWVESGVYYGSRTAALRYARHEDPLRHLPGRLMHVVEDKTAWAFIRSRSHRHGKAKPTRRAV